VRRRFRVGLVLCSLGGLGSLAAPALGDQGSYEVLRYRWRLLGVRGALAGLFLPGRGEGSLATGEADDGRLRSELVITSPGGRENEFWRYGAELDPSSGGTLRAWSSYLFRGEHRSREAELVDQGVVDIASGIYLIRQTPPVAPRRMRIWSDGRLYSVVVVPLESEQRQIGRRRVAVRHYSIRGAEASGERFWKGRLDLWLADDEASTPVEIRVERGWAAVKLELDELPGMPGAGP
jgi:hypothetical protein